MGLGLSYLLGLGPCTLHPISFWFWTFDTLGFGLQGLGPMVLAFLGSGVWLVRV